MNTPFLKAYVDATASNVNLSAKSRKIWSMSAVRSFIAFIVDSGDDGLEATPKDNRGKDRRRGGFHCSPDPPTFPICGRLTGLRTARTPK